MPDLWLPFVVGFVVWVIAALLAPYFILRIVQVNEAETSFQAGSQGYIQWLSGKGSLQICIVALFLIGGALGHWWMSQQSPAVMDVGTSVREARGE